MTTLQDRPALVLGGTGALGQATVTALVREGARVTVVARGEARLRALAAQVGDGLSTCVGDATDDRFVERILRERKPELVVLAVGVTPPMGPFEAFDWPSFSATWNADVKAAFHLVQAALRAPLAPGSIIVLLSSGAARSGSPLSGGYAGAKRTQWMLADYAQRESDARQLGLRFVAVLPGQLVAGTTIGTTASTAYGAMLGITAEEHMRRFGEPLTPDHVATAIVGALRGGTPAGSHAISVRGGAIVEALP